VSARRIVVVGASQAGCATAAALRRFGFDGVITLIGDESHPPYTRPPLSKGVLTGSEAAESVFLNSSHDIELLTGVTAVGLDRARNRVRLGDGETLGYDGLVIATGARARTLSEHASREITLRTLDDAVYLRRCMDNVCAIAVAGGGFLGLEIASSAASLGKTVTVVDQITPLAGRLGPLLSDMCLTAAADKGIKILVSRSGVKLGAAGRLEAPDGTMLAEGDIVVTAVGDAPNVEWLCDSGLSLAGGVIVDEGCQAAPGVVAAGDVVSLPGPNGTPIRSPHWSNALTQATIAAATLLGRPPETRLRSTPSFFWTEVFGMKIRLAGQLPPVGEPTVIDGSVEDRNVLLAWPSPDPGTAFGTAAAVNYPISAPKLTKLAQNPVKA